MKASLPLPPLPLSFPLSSFRSRFERNMVALSLMQMTRFFLWEQDVSTVTWTCDLEGSRQDSWGSSTVAVKRKKTTAKCLIFVISVISKKPGVKLFLAPQFKPLLFIFWPWNQPQNNSGSGLVGARLFGLARFSPLASQILMHAGLWWSHFDLQGSTGHVIICFWWTWRLVRQMSNCNSAP